MKRLLFFGGIVVLLISLLITPQKTRAADPYLDITGTVNPGTIYLMGVGTPDETTVTLNVEGKGDPNASHAPVDVILVIDVSGSMFGQPLTDEKTAANSFIDQMSATTDQVGVVSFDDVITLRQTLTTDFAAAKAQINALTTDSGTTNFGDAVQAAADELNGVRHRSNAAKVMIFMSDGDPNEPGGVDPYDYAVAKATAAKSNGITIYTIGLDVFDPTTLQLMASSTTGTNDHYYAAPTSGDLSAIYAQIAATFSNVAGQNAIMHIKLASNIRLVENTWSITPVSDNNGIYGFNIGSLDIGASWVLSFRIKVASLAYGDGNPLTTSAMAANNQVFIFDQSESNYTYVNYAGLTRTVQLSADLASIPQVGVLTNTPATGDWSIVLISALSLLFVIQLVRTIRIKRRKAI